jgi:murein DD-endopeptidase MepM/ murein hydrolase activator NlpD
MDSDYLMRVDDPLRKGLYRQLGWVVNQLSMGYYGWRRGILTDLELRDDLSVHLAPDLNAGSVALAYLFANLFDTQGWEEALGTKGGFIMLYKEMFADGWMTSPPSESLFPPGLVQPELILPFQPGKEWGYTSGPHNAWETEAALAALDFAPASSDPGCLRSNAWVVAVADGLVVRSKHGAVVLDLDGDGYEGTGWAVLYMHVESRHRVKVGTYLRQGDAIGHPSCEGGPANGTHVHIARKYNGEWIAADGPLPFVMSGWIAQAGYRPFEGSLTRNGMTVVANPLSPAQTFIQRPFDDILPADEIPPQFWWEE